MSQIDLSDKLQQFQTGVVIGRDEFTPEFQANMARQFFGLKNPEPQAVQPTVDENQMVVDKNEYERLQNYKKVVDAPGVLDKIGQIILGNAQGMFSQEVQQTPVQQQVPPAQIAQPQPQQQPVVGEQNVQADPWASLFGAEETTPNPQTPPAQGQTQLIQQPPVQTQQPLSAQQPQPQAQPDVVVQFNNSIAAEAIRQGLDPRQVLAQLESNFGPADIVNSLKTKMGVAQQPQVQQPLVQPPLSIAEEESPLRPVQNYAFSPGQANDPNSFRV